MTKPGKKASPEVRNGAKPSIAGIASVTRAATAPPPTRPMAKVETKPGVSISSTSGGQPTREAIAEAAYFLWLRRGGDGVANWLEAEALLRNKPKARV
jgi:hypothetical protein